MSQAQSPSLGRRERNKADRRSAIIDLAMRSFMQNGYEATTMSSIAKEMGGSKGTLWRYFESKEDLFSAIIDSATANFHKFTVNVLDEKQDIHHVLSEFCQTFIGQISSAEAIALQRLVVGQVDRFPAIGRIFFDRASAISHTTLTAFFSRQMAADILRTDDPGDAAHMLLDLCAGSYHERVIYGVESQNAETERCEVARVVEQFLRCYGPVSHQA